MVAARTAASAATRTARTARTALARPLLAVAAPPSLSPPAHRPPLRAMSATSGSPVYQTFSSPSAPAALGPYSQVVVHNGLAFLSGCVPFDPSTMAMVAGGEGDASAPGVIEKQTEQALKNLFAVLEAAGADRSSVLKTTVFLKDMGHFKRVNAVYEKMFAPYKPARSAVEVARLPFDVSVEVECIAAVIKPQA